MLKIKYSRARRTQYRYASAGVNVMESDDVVLWRKRKNGAFVVRTKRGEIIAYTGYGMDDDGPYPTLQAARTAAGRYLPSSRWSM